MSKLKQAELEESTLFVAEKMLVEIETYMDNMNFTNRDQVKNLKDMVDAFNQLKPYF